MKETFQENQENVLALSRSKEKCLQEFLQVTQTFVQMTDIELSHPDTGGERMDTYLNQRATILRALELFDRKLNEVIADLPKQELPQKFVSAAQQSLTNCDGLIQAIFRLDEIVFEKMRSAQERIELQLQVHSKNREILDRFKSQSKPNSGEGIDRSV